MNCLLHADIWSSEHEQAPLLVSLLRPALFSPFKMELHIRGADNSHYLELSSKANEMTERKICSFVHVRFSFIYLFIFLFFPMISL